MKQEIYSCIKMFESFRKSCYDAFNYRAYNSSIGLWEQYNHLVKNLKIYLNPQQIEFIPYVSAEGIIDNADEAGLLHRLSAATGVIISYLRSLEGNLNKEIEQKEKELEQREKELESYKKLLDKMMEVVKQLPEVYRSKAVAEWKKYHREIEKNTKENKE